MWPSLAVPCRVVEEREWCRRASEGGRQAARGLRDERAESETGSEPGRPSFATQRVNRVQQVTSLQSRKNTNCRHPCRSVGMDERCDVQKARIKAAKERGALVSSYRSPLNPFKLEDRRRAIILERISCLEDDLDAAVDSDRPREASSFARFVEESQTS